MPNNEFKIGQQYSSIYSIAEDILNKKHEKITKDKIDQTIKSILLYTNEKIKLGFIDHPLYDLNKIGKNSSGQFFNNNDQSDPDFVKTNDKFYYSEQTSNRNFDYSWNSISVADNPHKYILRNPQSHTPPSGTKSTSSQSTNYVESQATKALKKQINCNQAHDESNSDSGKRFACRLTNNNPAAAKFGHMVGSMASSSFTAGNGINYLLKDSNFSYDNPETLKALTDVLVGGASALNGLVCSLGTSEKKEFFKLMNEFSHDGSNYSLKKFNTQLNALCQRNLTLGRKVTDFLGHFNKTIFWSVNCGHKDAFGPLAQTFKSSTHLCCDAYKIYKGSIDENGQYSADLALKSVHTNAHSFIKNGFTTIVAAKAAYGYLNFRKLSNGLDDIVTSNLDRIAAKNTPRLSNKQLNDALQEIKSAELRKLDAQKIANSKAANAFKSIYVAGSAIDGSSALSKDRLKYLQLNSQLSSGILDKATYDEKCKLLEYRAAIQFSITASELTLVACKISNPMGWSLAIIDFAASLAMPSKEQLDQALISKGLDPELNPFQVDKFPIVELAAVLAAANGINGLTASLPETSAKYWDVVCELVLGRSANVFSEAASSYNETIQAERRSGNYLHNKM